MQYDTDLYPTRGEVERIRQRPDPVVYGSGARQSPHGLDAVQIESYKKNGYLVFPKLFALQESARLLQEAGRLSDSPDLQEREELIQLPDSNAIQTIFGQHKLSKVFDRLSRDCRILDKVTQLLGGPSYIHNGRIIIDPVFQEAHQETTPAWHSGFETWHAEDGIPRCRMVVGWLMLSANNEFSDPLHLIPESHNKFVSCAGWTDEDHFKYSSYNKKYGIPSENAVLDLLSRNGLARINGAPGTLVLFDGNMMHNSPDNISPSPRANLLFVYNSVDNQPEDIPFGAAKPRPEYLRNTDTTPLQPTENNFT